jgi:hypothetical protein
VTLPSQHQCDAADLEGFECPQRRAVACRVCGRKWYPQFDSQGRMTGWTPSHLPPRFGVGTTLGMRR